MLDSGLCLLNIDFCRCCGDGVTWMSEFDGGRRTSKKRGV